MLEKLKKLGCTIYPTGSVYICNPAPTTTDEDFLVFCRDEEIHFNATDPISQWISFAEYFLERGYSVNLYEARQTVSKYVTVSRMDDNLQFKVRFSNHAPIRRREEAGDCDFFVGRTNFKTTTTAMAIMSCLKRFESWQ